MLLLLGSLLVAAAVGAWVWVDAVRPVESWAGDRWDAAGRLPLAEPVTELLPVKAAA
jgi:hypothetical protein